MTEERKAYVGKVSITIAMAVLTAVMTGAGTAIYKHELSILKNARHIERLKIKDYRQHKEILRANVVLLSAQVNQIEAVLEMDSEVFGPNSPLILRARQTQLVNSRERLENYVEENKHGGRDD